MYRESYTPVLNFPHEPKLWNFVLVDAPFVSIEDAIDFAKGTVRVYTRNGLDKYVVNIHKHSPNHSWRTGKLCAVINKDGEPVYLVDRSGKIAASASA